MAIAWRVVTLVLLWVLAAPALEREPWDVFQARRRQLAAEHPDGVTVLFGYSESEGVATRSAFRQENNFYYLTGCNEPGAALLLLPGKDGLAYREVLFLPPRDTRQERWSGPRIAPGDDEIAAKTGFAEVRNSGEFEGLASNALEAYAHVYALLPQTPSYGHLPEPDAAVRLAKIRQDLKPRELRPTLTRLRTVKSEGEIRLIQKAIDATAEAHRAAWSMIRPGLLEYGVAGRMIGRLLEQGCERAAYPPIVGAGANAAILHYILNADTLRDGDLVLMDVGGEYSNYATDITRTVPVSGRFSARQRELYNVVLGAQKAALKAVKPGMRLGGHGPGSLTQIATDYLNSHGEDRGGKPLGPYFFHLVGHQVGLEVHDPGSEEELRAGMVITIEPGIYLPEEGIGIRIEDMVLVTEDGSRLLSAGLPREAEEIEAAMRR
jgi:Xaa-Pro aminopeptidase